MNVQEAIKTELLSNPAISPTHVARTPAFEIASELISARIQAGLTQGDVAASMGITQCTIARIESAKGRPSIRTVQRFVSAVGERALVSMEP